ncbi:MAG TPA: SDR family NAD(P)-dependent oxidoreductase [Jatrophihabitantaceae bacterium]|nr:SDR family NAD(P)-dependent oxidoreductase [Jatrophihabitantaceae bacterium]
MDRRLKKAIVAANRVLVTPVGLAGRHRKVTSRHALEQAAQGKVVLITGASSGIGEAAAVLLGNAGATVLLVARNKDELDRVRDEIAATGGTAHVYPCDLTDFDALDALVDQVLHDHGAVDVLVNNAAHSIRRLAEKSSGERFHDFERLIQLNYLAAIRLTLGLLPSMCARKSGQIINISSWAVQVRPARFAGYVASKAALEAWSDAVQSEVADDGVLFTVIRMPLVRTPMIAPTALYRRVPALRADEAAQSIADAIVCRPRRLRPAFSQLVEATEAVSPRMMDRVRKQVM